jgi:hypothetical protein
MGDRPFYQQAGNCKSKLLFLAFKLKVDEATNSTT